MGLRRSIVQLVSVAVFATIGVVLASGGPAAACSCVDRADVTAALADAKAVFSGEVTAVSAPPSAQGALSAEFAVHRVYKGEVGETISVRTSASDASCGVGFKAPLRFVVFADDGDTSAPPVRTVGEESPGLFAWACQGTGVIPSDWSVPAELGPGSTPPTTEVPSLDEAATASADENGPGPILPIWPTIAIGVLVALSAGWGVRRWERRRST
ncbi:MAG TPA: hypothetical protein VJM33_19650 [Microthrixaceae bacterium]|nr:hypothetical protein [Microthrixaceae bacterium]